MRHLVDRRKLGLPSDVKEYQVEVDKDAGLDENFMTQFKEHAHKAGILPKQAKALLDWYTGASKSTLEAYNNEIKAKNEAVEAELIKEWGQAYDKNMLAASLVMKDFGDESTTKFLKEAVLADGVKLEKHPAFLNLMNKIGQSLKEEAIKGGIQARGMDPNALDPVAAQKEYGRILGDFKHPYYDTNHPNHGAAVAEVQRLMAMAYPPKK